jgi:hypothetical protein
VVSKLRFLLLSLAVILAIALGGGVYWLLQSQGIIKGPELSKLLPWESPTKDWNTYTNQELGFSFKYPKEWGNVKFSTNPGEQGTSFQGEFTTTENGMPRFNLYTIDWSRPIGVGPIFAYYTKNKDGTYNYHRRDGSILVSFNATKVLKTENGGEAVIVGDQNASEFVQKYRESLLTSNRRFAFINFEAKYLGKDVKGVEFVYADITENEEKNFDLMISTLEFTD